MIPNTNEIHSFVHCGLCLEEIHSPKLVGKHSPREYAQLEVGFTEVGLQIWCKRHECNVLHIDFEGQCHPSNSERIK